MSRRLSLSFLTYCAFIQVFSVCSFVIACWLGWTAPTPSHGLLFLQNEQFVNRGYVTKDGQLRWLSRASVVKATEPPEPAEVYEVTIVRHYTLACPIIIWKPFYLVRHDCRIQPGDQHPLLAPVLMSGKDAMAWVSTYASDADWPFQIHGIELSTLTSGIASESRPWSYRIATMYALLTLLLVLHVAHSCACTFRLALAWKQKRRSRRGLCTNCAYPKVGSQCPECGTTSVRSGVEGTN
jgi:hypothetical protein